MLMAKEKKMIEPFLTMLDFKNRPKEWGNRDLNHGPVGYEGAGPP